MSPWITKVNKKCRYNTSLEFNRTQHHIFPYTVIYMIAQWIKIEI